MLVAGLSSAGSRVATARKAIGRADTAYVAGCLFRVVELCALVLHGDAGSKPGQLRAAVDAAAPKLADVYA